MKVYFSHTGINNLLPMIEVDCKGTFLDLLNDINSMPEYSGLKSHIAVAGKVISSARAFLNVLVQEEEIEGKKNYKFYEKESTIEISSLDKTIPGNTENMKKSYL